MKYVNIKTHAKSKWIDAVLNQGLLVRFQWIRTAFQLPIVSSVGSYVNGPEINCMKPTITHHILTHVEWSFNPNMVGEVRDLKFLKIPISYYIPWHYHFPQLSRGKFPMSLVVPLEKMESRLQPGQQHLAQTHQRGAAVGTGGSTAKAPRCGQDRSPGSRSCHGSWMVMQFTCSFFWVEKNHGNKHEYISILMTWRILKHLCFPVSGQINAVSRIWAVDASCFDAVWSSNGGYRVNKTWQGTKSDHFCRCFAAMFGDQHGYSYGGIRRNPVC